MKKKRLSVSAIETLKTSRMSTKRLTADSKFFAPAGLTQRQIALDLEAMGVEKSKVWKIARTKERPMDALGLPVPKKVLEPESDSEEGNNRVFGIMASGRKRKRTARATAAGEEEEEKGDYTPLVLTPGRSANWVLLDPARWAPEELVDLPYKTIYHYYKPGNAKILEYNIVSRGVRIKSPPAVLKDRSVEYRATGPVIIDPNDPAAGEKETKEPDTRSRKKTKLGPSKPSFSALDTMPDGSTTTSPSTVESPSFPGSSGKKSSISVKPRRPMFPNLALREDPASSTTASSSAAVSDAAVAGSSGSKSRSSGRSAAVVEDSDEDAEMGDAGGSDYDGGTTQPEPTPTKDEMAKFAMRRSGRAGKGVKKYTR